MEWLRSQRPDLVPLYEKLYANGAYVPVAERRRLAALLPGPVKAPTAPAGSRRAVPASLESISRDPELRLRKIAFEGSHPGAPGPTSSRATSQQAEIGLQKALF